MDPFDDAIREHDEALRASGLVVWVGGEPTFSDRSTFAAEWSWAAHGDDKEARARRVVARLHEGSGGVVLRTLGRQYAGEDLPRWSYGSWARRDRTPVWSGPPDPLEHDVDPSNERVAPASAGELAARSRALRDAIAESLRRKGAMVATVDLAAEPRWRLVYRTDGLAPADDPEIEPRLARRPVGEDSVPESGVVDELAERGTQLLSVGLEPGGAARLELPQVPTVDAFVSLLDAIAEGAAATGCAALVLGGFPPPVDASIAWTTVTPDPGVLEINMAPSTDAAAYLAALRRTRDACVAEGLSPLRYLYTGEIVDSGGGGHVTLGGPSADESPFARWPHLLPALVSYANRHPCLSYLFAAESLGSSSQSPRPDECVRESFDELCFAIDRLALRDEPDTETLWRALAPFLVDRSGNSHRAEINVEKLWNPYLPGRGRLGVVEMRAFRMARTPERGAAVAALLRAVSAMLVKERRILPLIDWGEELHDRWMLPHHLESDLHRVIADLSVSGFHLGSPIVAQLLDDDDRRVGLASAMDHDLLVRRAIETWPLVGDASTQERSTSRTVDPSGRRLELRMRARPGVAPAFDRCRLSIDGRRLPRVLARDAHGEAWVVGLRYRAFVPAIGLHPGLPAR
ncbi:MAG: transglutaminase family protein, partial [Deltaproteobacteria bacterium]|nr:transglutaminase family protein [Deltaproteobacteria bacterium]